MSGIKGMRKYSLELKLEAVRLFIEEGMTRREISELLGLRSPENVKEWVKKYRRDGKAGLCKTLGRPRTDPESVEAELKRLRMENTLLKKYHTELRNMWLAKRDIGSSTIIERNSQ